MGYTHDHYQAKRLPQDRFADFAGDCRKILAACEAIGIDLAGGDGTGRPVVTTDEIRFNGSDTQALGPWTTTAAVSIPWPSETASLEEPELFDDGTDGDWFAGTVLSRRVAPEENGVGSGSYETFMIEREYTPEKWSQERNGLYFCCTKTAYRPYDLPVTACLVAAHHYFVELERAEGRPALMDISSDGEEKDWLDGALLCQRLFGYGMPLTVLDDAPPTVLHGLPVELAETILRVTPDFAPQYADLDEITQAVAQLTSDVAESVRLRIESERKMVSETAVRNLRDEVEATVRKKTGYGGGLYCVTKAVEEHGFDGVAVCEAVAQELGPDPVARGRRYVYSEARGNRAVEVAGKTITIPYYVRDDWDYRSTRREAEFTKLAAALNLADGGSPEYVPAALLGHHRATFGFSRDAEPSRSKLPVDVSQRETTPAGCVAWTPYKSGRVKLYFDTEDNAQRFAGLLKGTQDA